MRSIEKYLLRNHPDPVISKLAKEKYINAKLSIASIVKDQYFTLHKDEDNVLKLWRDEKPIIPPVKLEKWTILDVNETKKLRPELAMRDFYCIVIKHYVQGYIELEDQILKYSDLAMFMDDEWEMMLLMELQIYDKIYDKEKAAFIYKIYQTFTEEDLLLMRCISMGLKRRLKFEEIEKYGTLNGPTAREQLDKVKMI